MIELRAVNRLHRCRVLADMHTGPIRPDGHPVYTFCRECGRQFGVERDGDRLVYAPLPLPWEPAVVRGDA